MSLQLVYGRAGSGKSQFCLEKAKEYLTNNLDKKVFIIVPEQFSYAMEKKLLEVVNKKSVINAEIISFKRIAERIFQEVGGANKVCLSKAGKNMLLNDILESTKTLYLGKTNENIDICLRLITELKKHNITLEILEEQIKNTDEQLLKIKLQDIYNIYSSYQERILNNFIDEDDILTLLYKNIDKSNMFDNTYVFFDEFAGFTTQEYMIIEKIMEKAEKVYITSCVDKIEEPINPAVDVFYSNKKTVKKLINCAKNAKVEIESPIELKETYRFKNEELKFLEKNIYGIPYNTYKKDINNIELNLYSNTYEEIENTAKRIVKKVKDGYRYRDIAIITKNLEEYSAITKAIFEKYDIPVFIDEKSKLSTNILIKYILSIFDIFAKNWSNQSVWTYIKTGFLSIEKEDLYDIENYCKKWGIKRNKWYEADWNYDKEKVDLEKINNIRKEIVNPLVELQTKLKQNKTVTETTKVLYEFLEQNNIKAKLENKIKYLNEINMYNLADEYFKSWETLGHILDEIVLVFKDQKVSFEKYRKILKVGLEASSLGVIPQGLDQIILGDIERSRTHKVKEIFILGLNDGTFPSSNREEGFLNDSDRENLKNSGIEIANGTLENIYEEQFNIYKAFSTAENVLHLSYISSDKDGKAKRPSILINRIKKIFPSLKENNVEEIFITNDKATFGELLLNIRNKKNGQKTDKIWEEIYNWYFEKEEWKNKLLMAEKGFNYTNEAENLNQKNIDNLYGDTLKTSVSRLEQYKRCPFSFYLKYGLNLKQEEEYTIKPLDTGSFMHDVIDNFFSQVKNIKELEDYEIQNIVNEIIEEKLKLNKNYIFLSSPKFVVLTERLKKVILQSIKYIVEQIKNSDFEQEGHEVEFSRNIDNVRITGKIDRIDSITTKEGKYIRIIDYKSSEKDINLNEMLSGTQIQLITYIDSIVDNEKTKPSGILYFNLIDPIIKTNKNLTDEEIKNQIKKNFKMNGMILADVKVIKAMDKTLEQGYSESLPVYIGKDNEISKSKSNTVTKEEFTRLQETAKKIIKNISKEILKGNIEIKPTYNKKTKNSNCKFCEYKTICQFNPKVNKYAYIENKTKEQILEEIKNK